MRPRLLLMAGLLVAALPAGLGGQALPVGDLLEEYLRALELLGKAPPGAVTVRPAPVWVGQVPGDTVRHPWQRWLRRDRGEGEGGDGPRGSLDPVGVRTSWNSEIPFGWNDGAVWRGVGATVAVEGGATGSWGPLSVTVRPTLIYNQNASMGLVPVSRPGATRYGYPWRRIDLPQRFGPDPFWTLDPGQTMVRLTWRGISAGFGTENLWWGPGTENAILMSNNAAGFPHASLATGRPVNVGIGTLEAQWIWGRLGASDWADDVTGLLDNYALSDTRFITGAVWAFKPRGLEEVTLGAGRVFTLMVPRGGMGVGDYFLIFQRGTKDNFVSESNPGGEDLRNQMLSLFARWARPGSGFEAYVEWARDDHALDFKQVLLEPAHSQGFTLGFRQAKPLSGDRFLSFHGEVTTLERGETAKLYDLTSWYENWSVPTGHTQKGQLLGAHVGPGGNGQFLAADLFAPWGRAGVFLRRRVWDNDAYWKRAAAEELGICCHDVSITGGARSLILLDDMAVGVEGSVTRAYNRLAAWRDIWNVGLAVSLTQRRRFAPEP